MSNLRHARFYDIRKAVIVFILLPFAAITAATGWYGLQRLEEHLTSSMEEEIELIARTIRLPLTHALQHGHTATLRRTVTSAYDVDKVYAVYVYDKDGRRISTTGSAKARVADREALDMAAQSDGQGEFDEVGGEALYSYFLPLIDNAGNSIGLLQVTRRGSDFTQYIDKFRVAGVLALALFTGLVTGVFWLGYQRAIGRHISGMLAAMQRIADGDTSRRLVPSGPAEFQFLVQGVNSMLDSITASERELAARRAQQQALTERLQQSEKLAAIGRFAAGVAHELGTPLSVADGKIQRALRGPQHDHAVLSQIRQQLQRMERIIRQLMDFARPVKPSASDIAWWDLIRSALAQVEPERARHSVTLAVADAVPEVTVSGNRLRLEQALINLLRNAIQAAPGGRVQVSWRIADRCLVLSVEDDGAGIGETPLPQLMEPFFTTKPIGQGTGLGLAVVNAVVTEHGGAIWVEPSQLGGACFCLQLPLNIDRTTETEACL